MMMAPMDFYVNFTFHMSDEVIRIGCATIGFAIAIWGVVKLVTVLANKSPKQLDNEST